MHAVVVYESIYGNTRAIAEAIAEGLGGAEVIPVHAAAEAVREDGGAHIEPGATDEPGLRAWLRDVPHRHGADAAAFDTRLDQSPWLTGVASRGIAKRLRARGYDVLSSQSFLVEDSEGPLEGGELERARAWGAELAEALTAAAR